MGILEKAETREENGRMIAKLLKSSGSVLKVLQKAAGHGKPLG
jgi:hypothetical protein